MKPDKKEPKDSPFMKSVKNLDLILRLLGRILILLLVVWILWAFRKAYLDDTYVFEPFSVPPTLSERGYTGEVVADKIMSEMNSILSKDYFNAQNPDAYRKIVAQPTLKFSAGRVERVILIWNPCLNSVKSFWAKKIKSSKDISPATATYCLSN